MSGLSLTTFVPSIYAGAGAQTGTAYPLAIDAATAALAFVAAPWQPTVTNTDMVVHIAAGTVPTASGVTAIAAQPVTLGAAHATLPRIDRVVLDRVTGTATFAQAMALDACVCTTAKTTYNDNANAVLLSTAGANGSEYTRIGAMPRATVTATQLQLYAYDGANYWLIASALMAAYTMAQTTQAPATQFTHLDGNPIDEFSPLRLQSGWKLYAAIGVALASGVVFQSHRKDY